MKLAVDYFGWEKVILLGHSMGYLAAMFWSSMYPKKVERIISLDLIKPPPMIEAEFPARMAKALSEIQQAMDKVASLKNGGKAKGMTYNEARDKMVKVYRGLSGLEEKDADVLLRRGLRKIGGEEELFEYTWDPRAALRMYLLTDGQVETMIRAINCPLLLIRPDRGLSWPFDTEQVERRYHEIYRQSSSCFRLIQFPGRHHAHLTHPETVLPHILRFLNEDGQSVIPSIPLRSISSSSRV